MTIKIFEERIDLNEVNHYKKDNDYIAFYFKDRSNLWIKFPNNEQCSTFLDFLDRELRVVVVEIFDKVISEKVDIKTTCLFPDTKK